MGALASRGEIGVWVQAPGGGRSARVRGYHRQIVYAKSCIFGRKMVHSVVRNALLNTLRMKTSFPRVPPRNDPCCNLVSLIQFSQPVPLASLSILRVDLRVQTVLASSVVSNVYVQKIIHHCAATKQQHFGSVRGMLH